MAHLHGVVDVDKHFVIDAATREITNQSNKLTLMQNDHNSERFTFEIPREIDGHDMSLCNVVRIHYLNIDTTTKAQNPGFYEVEDLQISSDDDSVVVGSWLISSNATKNVGNLNFTIRFKCVDDDGTINYAWSSAIFKGISIGQSYNNAGTVAEEYADIFLQWQARIEALEQGGSSDFPRVFYCNSWVVYPNYDRAFDEYSIYPDEITPNIGDYIISGGAVYIIEKKDWHYYLADKLADICGGSDEETISAEKISYTNENLQDKSGTVKAALDESIGFVVSELPDLVAKKHSHDNKGILDKFGENESGEPIYNGKTISIPEKQFVTISGTTSEYFMPISNNPSTVSLYLYNNIYEGHEIKNLWFNIDGTKIDVKNLSALDGNPYVINMDKLITSPLNSLLHVVTLCAPSTPSDFISNLGAYVDYEFELEIYL